MGEEREKLLVWKTLSLFADDAVTPEKSHRIPERFCRTRLVADEVVADKRAGTADSNCMLYWEKRSWDSCKDKEISGKIQ